MQKKHLLLCALLGALAVVLGAFGAHGLRSLLEPAALNTWETAVQYHFIHVLAMLVIAFQKEGSPALKRSFTFFALGILFFSGSLYFLSLKDLMGIESIGPLGLITPLGGLFFIAGWVMIFFHKGGK